MGVVSNILLPETRTVHENWCEIVPFPIPVMGLYYL